MKGRMRRRSEDSGPGVYNEWTGEASLPKLSQHTHESEQGGKREPGSEVGTGEKEVEEDEHDDDSPPQVDAEQQKHLDEQYQLQKQFEDPTQQRLQPKQQQHQHGQQQQQNQQQSQQHQQEQQQQYQRQQQEQVAKVLEAAKAETTRQISQIGTSIKDQVYVPLQNLRKQFQTHVQQIKQLQEDKGKQLASITALEEEKKNQLARIAALEKNGSDLQMSFVNMETKQKDQDYNLQKLQNRVDHGFALAASYWESNVRKKCTVFLKYNKDSDQKTCGSLLVEICKRLDVTEVMNASEAKVILFIAPVSTQRLLTKIVPERMEEANAFEKPVIVVVLNKGKTVERIEGLSRHSKEHTWYKPALGVIFLQYGGKLEDENPNNENSRADIVKYLKSQGFMDAGEANPCQVQ
eukprot:gb/GEZN01005442.1/.p1 GENE.gb/GEZN01005442.1/~~gb/GEZN01005442.1/.p1  ORF type:complete len:407 (+),score=82.77 gb/GEZN01005442.1/:120-1340(+)